MKLSYNKNLLLVGEWLQQYIDNGYLEWVNGGIIEDVPLNQVDNSLLKNDGRADESIDDKDSQEFKAKLDSDFKNPKIGWRNGTLAAVFLIEEEGANHRILSNQGFGHKVGKAIDLGVETVPGVLVRFTSKASEDDRLEIKQELQDCENNPDNHPSSNPVKEQDRISSLKRYQKIYGLKELKGKTEGLSEDEYLKGQLVKMGVTESQTQINLIDKVTGTYSNISRPLTSKKTVATFITEQYKSPKQFSDYEGDITIPDDWEGFKKKESTTPIQVFSDVDTKVKIIHIPHDTRGRDLGYALDYMDDKIESGEDYSMGFILTVEKLCKDLSTFDEKRKELYNYTKKQCKVFNNYWGQERAFILGITANRENEKDKQIGLLTPLEYESRFNK